MPYADNDAADMLLATMSHVLLLMFDAAYDGRQRRYFTP